MCSMYYSFAHKPTCVVILEFVLEVYGKLSFGLSIDSNRD